MYEISHDIKYNNKLNVLMEENMIKYIKFFFKMITEIDTHLWLSNLMPEILLKLLWFTCGYLKIPTLESKVC